MDDVSDFVIRPCRPAELDAVGVMTVEVYVGEGYVDGAGDYAQYLAATRQHATHATVLVAVDGDALLGSVVFCRNGSPLANLAQPGEAEFRMLAVASAARRRGVGEALVRACLDLARTEDDRAVVLSTQPDMTAAHRVYERLGFRRAPERDWSPVADVELMAYRHQL